MKITIYELLGMIKDGNAPYKVKYKNEIYIMDDLEYFYVDDESKKALFESIFDNYSDYVALNEEVEIIDNLEIEKKIPEKLNIEDDGNTITLFGEKENEWTILDNVDVSICNKINEIIDYLKSKGE